MSTDRQRLKTAIQRIAEKSPAISKAIGASKNRGGQASSTGVGVSDAERDNLCCDGSAGPGANAGADTRDPEEGGEDGLGDDDPADLSMGQGSLTGVTDCATGEPICFEGSDWIPPEGWDAPNDPPIDPSFIEGQYGYLNAGGNISYTRTCGQARSAALGIIDACGFDTGGLPACPDTVSVSFGISHDQCPGLTVTARALDCPGPDGICDEPPPTETAWPEDGCVNLAIKGGKLVSSKFDPENDGSYSAPRDELEVCDSSGNRILLRGSPTGGWKSIKSLDGDIDPGTGAGYLYRPNGQRVRQISPSEFRDDAV